MQFKKQGLRKMMRCKAKTCEKPECTQSHRRILNKFLTQQTTFDVRLGGFTLIELLFVIAIIGILFGIGIPSYQDSVRKGKRAEGIAQLLQSASQLERIFSETNSYQNLNNAVPATTQEGHYTLSLTINDVDGGSDNGYTLTAAPTFSDPHCGSLTLDDGGHRGCTGGDYCETNAARCW